ncbi:hypothetical protein ABMY26_06165 [Azospirillum sp. HJ39]|uniref:hypothetical protein n=1 Tax=Azospirillum sp. HJ39 TaxID=3159496 RepID=UPI003558504B
MLKLHRRQLLLSCVCAGGACLASKLVGAQQGNATQRGAFICATLEPPLQQSGLRFEPFNAETGPVTLSPFAAERLTNEFRFTPFGLASARDRWMPSDGLTPSGKVTLSVFFLNGTSQEHNQCIRAASEWLRDGVDAYLDFSWNVLSKDKVDPKDAHIRVRFGHGGNWSLIGRNALGKTNRDEPTMNIADVVDNIIMHEFGHALGLRHEHQHPTGGIKWAERAVINAMAKEDPPWSEEYTRANVFTRYDTATQCIGDPEFNDHSLMMYPIPKEWTVDQYSATPSPSITPRDRRCVRGLYAL